jgi:hypothetical protein
LAWLPELGWTLAKPQPKIVFGAWDWTGGYYDSDDYDGNGTAH